MKYYHGTTRQDANNILANMSKTSCTWIVSDDDNLYLWSPDAMLKAGEKEEIADCETLSIQYAFESAQITAAISDYPVNELVVLCFEFPSDFNDDILYPDQSCENMDYAVLVDMNYIENIREYLVDAFSSKHNPRLDCFIVSGVIDNPHFNTTKIDDDLEEACSIVKDLYLDSFMEFDWKSTVI